MAENRFYTRIFNSMRELEEFVNSHGIQKDDIVSIDQHSDHSFMLAYYGK